MNIGRTQCVVGGAGNGKHTQTYTHTHTHNVSRDTQGGWSLRQCSEAILTHVGVGPTITKLMCYEHREDAVGGGGSRQWQRHTNTHTHSVPRDTEDGWSLGQGSEAILTHVSVAHPLTKLVGYVHREYAVWGWRSGQLPTHTNTHTHRVPVIHRVDGASGNDRKQS